MKNKDVLTPMAQLALLNELGKRYGFTEIEAEFDGSGDSGTVSEWTACLPPDHKHDSKTVEQINREIGEIVDQQLTYLLLEKFCVGWDLDDGSFGSVRMVLASGAIQINQDVRVMTTEHDEFTTNIFDL